MFFTFFVTHDSINEGGIMEKSISSFINTLIFSIIGAICSYVFWIVFVLVSAFASDTIKTICNVVPFINLTMFCLSFIFSFIYLKRIKLTAVLTLITSIINFICLLILCISLKTFSFMFILFWLPALIILLISIKNLAIKNKS